MSLRPRVPDEHYLWLGKVSAAFAMLDLQIGFVGWAAKTGLRYTEDWQKVAGTPGQAWGLAKKAVATLPTDLAEQVQTLLDQVTDIREERHTLAHAVFIFDPEANGPSGPWVTKSPRGVESQLLTESRASELVARINRASREAGDLAGRIASQVGRQAP